MIIGDPTQCGKCPHGTGGGECLAINEQWGFCFLCFQMVQLAKPKIASLKNPLTRELPRPRQDPPVNPPNDFSLNRRKDC